VLIDETGLMLQPLVRRTWAPRGQTPVMYGWDRHDRLSVLAGLTLAARRNRLGLYFTVHGHNITADELVAFLCGVQRNLRRRLIVVLDRWSVHRKTARILQDDRRFTFEWLPGYAPDLNPVEHVWSHTKYGDLANYVPADVVELECAVDCSLQETRHAPGMLRSFFHAAELDLS
jgi:transposase